MSAWPYWHLVQMQFVITLKEAMFASVSHHTSMLTTPMIAYVRNASIPQFAKFLLLKNFRSTQNDENFLHKYYLKRTHEIDKNIVTQNFLT